MRELHMRHHFQDDTRGFGVSAPFWDSRVRDLAAPLRRTRIIRRCGARLITDQAALLAGRVEGSCG